jgi:hypothetical protein
MAAKSPIDELAGFTILSSEIRMIEIYPCLRLLSRRESGE